MLLKRLVAFIYSYFKALRFCIVLLLPDSQRNPKVKAVTDIISLTTERTFIITRPERANMDADYESVLLIVRECFVYRIPPLTKAQGYRASDWGDLGTDFLWKGRLRIVRKGSTCIIRLEDASTGEVFAVCPYDSGTNAVEQVLDSSRYFVLKIENEGRHAFIGMGFLERSDAFDFNVTLQDFTKQLRAEKEADLRATTVDDTPKKDYSLKEGQTININIGNVGKRARPRPANNPGVNNSNGFMPILPPPPSASQVKQNQQKQQQPHHNQLPF